MLDRLRSIIAASKKKKQMKARNSLATCSRCEAKDQDAHTSSYQSRPHFLSVVKMSSASTQTSFSSSSFVEPNSPALQDAPKPSKPITLLRESVPSHKPSNIVLDTITLDDEPPEPIISPFVNSSDCLTSPSTSLPSNIAETPTDIFTNVVNDDALMDTSPDILSDEQTDFSSNLLSRPSLPSPEIIFSVGSVYIDSSKTKNTFVSRKPAQTVVVSSHSGTGSMAENLTTETPSASAVIPSVRSKLVKEVTLVAPTAHDFRQPVSIRPRSQPPSSSACSADKTTKQPVKTAPPKPFIDLPKGNRRLGRRPNWKRLVVPRVLPLLPKPVPFVSGALVSPTAPVCLAIIPTSAMAVPSAGMITMVCPHPTETVCVNTTTSSPKVSAGLSVASEAGAGTRATSTIASVPMQVSSKPRGVESRAPRTTASQNQLVDRPVETNCLSDMLPLSASASDFDDILKMRRHDDSSSVSADIDNLSLSSFMEISLPESSRMAAQELVDDLDADLENSNSSLNLSRKFSTPLNQLLFLAYQQEISL